jgi:hypothetical protein
MSDTAPNSFAQLLTHWQGFFSMAGTAAATLVGLLFVAVSLHLDLFSDDRERQTRISAQQTLTNFFNVLVLALLFNIPDWTTSLIGKGTMFVGGVSFFRAIWMLIKHAHGGWSKLLGLPLVSRSYLTFLLRQVLFPIAAYGFITVAGAMLNDGNTDALNLLAGLIIAVLVGAGWSAWNLMINLSRYRTRRNSAQNQANSVAKPNIMP